MTRLDCLLAVAAVQLLACASKATRQSPFVWKCQINAPVQTTISPVAFSFSFGFLYFQIPPTFFPAKIYLREFIKQKGGLGGGHKQVRWVIRKSNTLSGIIVCLSPSISPLSPSSSPTPLGGFSNRPPTGLSVSLYLPNPGLVSG